jgi:hypothetical protein
MKTPVFFLKNRLISRPTACEIISRVAELRHMAWLNTISLFQQQLEAFPRFL